MTSLEDCESALLECELATRHMRELFGVAHSSPSPRSGSAPSSAEDRLESVVARVRAHAQELSACQNTLQRIYEQASLLESRLDSARTIWKASVAKIADMIADQREKRRHSTTSTISTSSPTRSQMWESLRKASLMRETPETTVAAMGTQAAGIRKEDAVFAALEILAEIDGGRQVTVGTPPDPSTPATAIVPQQ
jgi:chromosome segregation ATPase